uniref:Uncharacterized protein n=1 Tax=Zea mays TaxID=4577 RepID=A0A804MAZ4_MAIZE
MIYRKWSLLSSTVVIWCGVATAGLAGIFLLGGKRGLGSRTEPRSACKTREEAYLLIYLLCHLSSEIGCHYLERLSILKQGLGERVVSTPSQGGQARPCRCAGLWAVRRRHLHDLRARIPRLREEYRLLS